MPELNIPIDDETIRGLRCGEAVLLNGVMLTARDAAHKWMTDTFIRKLRPEQDDDAHVHTELERLLRGGVIYHCGPVVSGLDTKEYVFMAAGPTTSIREEPYQAEVLKHFNIKGVIGKGGMGEKTLAACADTPAVYLHAIGGAASYLAQRVTRVLGVLKLEFGVPEAMWVIEVRQFPAVVTMDAQGGSLHAQVEQRSRRALEALLARA
jgi:fumarate hydratase class I